MEWLRRTVSGWGRRATQIPIWEAQRVPRTDEARRSAFEGAGQLKFDEVLAGLPQENVVYVGLDHADRLVLATSPSDPERSYAGRDESPGGPSFPHSVATESYGLTIQVLDEHGSSIEVSTSLSLAHPQVQPTADGGFLLVGARARYTSDGPESNALVLDDAGAVVGSFCIGDGVEDVQVTPSGKIWVGYFDEGVYGNYGWGGADGPEPLGRSGLAQWSLGGELEYEFSTVDGLDRIDDCYALNVIDEDAWAYYYANFPVVRMRPDGSVTTWECGVAGARGIAALGAERVGLIGGYDGLVDRLVVAELGDGQCTGVRTWQLVGPEGAELSTDVRVMARGSSIHALANGSWLRIDLRDLPA